MIVVSKIQSFPCRICCLFFMAMTACFPAAAAESWKTPIVSAAAKTATTPFSASIYHETILSRYLIEVAGTEPLMYTFQQTDQNVRNYYLLFKDEKLYCAKSPIAKAKRIAINETRWGDSFVLGNAFVLLFPQRISRLIQEIENVDYTDLGESSFYNVQCKCYRIEFYDNPADMQKVYETLWPDMLGLKTMKEKNPNNPYRRVPFKYDLFIGKKDGFLYGWRIYQQDGRSEETALVDVTWNPDFPPGTFALPDDCEIETIDDEQELEIFFKTQRTSLSKRITTKTLRFFSTNGVYLVLGLSLLLISTAVMIRKVRNARR